MVKSLHKSLEAKLASIEAEPHYESEEEATYTNEQEPATYTTISKRGKSSKRKQKDPSSSSAKLSSSQNSNSPTSVIYLGHLPTAFEERELLTFLNQFGPVSKCRVSRSPKTGRSRNYAFIEFSDPSVASIVADTMNGYILLEKRLVCHVLPSDKVYDLMFRRSKKVVSKKVMQDKARMEVNRRKTPEVMKGITAKLMEREEAKRRKLVELGIDYDFPGYAASASVKSSMGGDKEGKKAKKRKVSMEEDDKENSADETEENAGMDEVKTPKKAGKTKKNDKANTEVKKDKKKKEKKRKSLA
ncbi:hypothetical protein ACHAXN_010035 [Cyclotella atomus]